MDLLSERNFFVDVLKKLDTTKPAKPTCQVTLLRNYGRKTSKFLTEVGGEECANWCGNESCANYGKNN